MATMKSGAVGELRIEIGGNVAEPGEAGYEVAVNIWNGAIVRRPALVASCTSSSDIAAALAFARREGLDVSVRGGGHNYAGFALCDDGLMIDLTPMKYVNVDADAVEQSAAVVRPGVSLTRPLRLTGWPCQAASSATPVSLA